MGNDICKIVVINLDSRPDRMVLADKELRRIGLNYTRFPAIKGRSGENGCALSHFECLKNGDGPLFLLEDDVVFDEGALDILVKGIDQAPEDWDLIYLGANVKLPADRYSDNLYKITGGVHCTHAILYSAQGRKKIVELWDPNGDIKQIDQWMYVEGQGKMNCFVLSPMVAWQREGYSDVRLGDMDYREEMIENAKKNMQ